MSSTIKNANAKLFRYNGINISVPTGTENIVNIDNVIVPKLFLDHPPVIEKIEKAIKFYIAYGFLDSPITIDKDAKIINGLSRYYASLKLEIPYIPIVIGIPEREIRLDAIPNFRKYIDQRADYTIYTDGSYSLQDKAYCGAYIILDMKGQIIDKRYTTGINDSALCNNYAELLPITQAMELSDTLKSKITIRTDSSAAESLFYGTNLSKAFWTRSGIERWREAIAIFSHYRHAVRLERIKGHNYNQAHNYVDRMCKIQLKNYIYSIQKLNCSIAGN